MSSGTSPEKFWNCKYIFNGLGWVALYINNASRLDNLRVAAGAEFPWLPNVAFFNECNPRRGRDWLVSDQDLISKTL